MHALNQVIDFKIPEIWYDLKKLKYFLNSNLPQSIFIKNISATHEHFHSRFSAKKRVYRYIVSTKELTPFNSKYLTYYKNLDIQKLNSSIKLFVGVHDFCFFKKNGSDNKNNTREIYKAFVYQYRDLVIFNFEANSFLRAQIRMMMGFLFQINDDKLSHNDLIKQLQCKHFFNYKLANANGLYLSKIKY